MFIWKTSALTTVCEWAKTCKVVAIDTEFVWRKTYWPKLCLIQIGLPGKTFLVDALSPQIEMAPLMSLLRWKNTLKVIHSAEQDVGILKRVTGAFPEPLYDTQVAAMFCGFRANPGYALLVEELLNIKLNKSQQTTDWSKRPLSQRQIDYAARDVAYLPEVYEKLEGILKDSKKQEWALTEMKKITPEALIKAGEKQWRRVPLLKRDAVRLGVLKEVWHWREYIAQKRNRPRRWVMSDQVLASIAHALPTDHKSLKRVPSVSSRIIDGYGGQILASVDKGRKQAKNRDLVKQAAKPLTPPDPALVKAIMKLLHSSAEENGVAQCLIATRKEVNRLAHLSGLGKSHEDMQVLQGWRRDIFGQKALTLIRKTLIPQTALTG